MPSPRLTPVSPPDPYIVSLEEAKAHLNVNFSDDDAMIESMIKGVQAGMEHELGRALTPQTWDLTYDSFPGCPVGSTFPTYGSYYWSGGTSGQGIQVPLPPLIEVTSIFYVDPDSLVEVELDPDAYQVDATRGDFGWIEPSSDGWPTPYQTINAVRIRFIAGYPLWQSPEELSTPQSLKLAALLLLRDYYDQRGTYVVGSGVMVSAIPDAVKRLMMPFQVYWV